MELNSDDAAAATDEPPEEYQRRELGSDRDVEARKKIVAKGLAGKKKKKDDEGPVDWGGVMLHRDKWEVGEVC